MTGVGHECAGASRCIRSCRCSRCASALYCLTVAYSRLQSAGDHGDPTLDFLRGHLAMLFGLLMQGNVANQMVLLKTLPGSSDSVKLHTLLCRAQEFLAVYADFRSGLFATSAWRVNQNDTMPSITEDEKAESVASNARQFVSSEAQARGKDVTGCDTHYLRTCHAYEFPSSICSCALSRCTGHVAGGSTWCTLQACDNQVCYLCRYWG